MRLMGAMTWHAYVQLNPCPPVESKMPAQNQHTFFLSFTLGRTRGTVVVANPFSDGFLSFLLYDKM